MRPFSMVDTMRMIYNRRLCDAPEGALYIGRGSVWGNPFVVGRHGTRTQVIDMYETRLKGLIDSGEVSLESLASLHNQPLLCYCYPNRCHGDVLVKYAKWAWNTLYGDNLITLTSP